jgi:hypothetical protein
VFTVIQGGRSLAQQAVEASTGPIPSDVRKEADRRRDAYGINSLRNRQMATGALMPRDLHYLGLQIDFSAETLCKLMPIPEDFRADGYWPQVVSGNNRHC